MADELHRLFRVELSGSSGGYWQQFFDFGKSRTNPLNEDHRDRLEYDKFMRVWDDLPQSHGSYVMRSYRQGSLTLPDSTMALCIGLVVGYMIYIVISLMFQPKLSLEEDADRKERVVFISEHKFQENVIPDVIRKLYQPHAEIEKFSLLHDTGDMHRPSDTNEAILNYDIGVHAGAGTMLHSTPVQTL